MRRAKKQGLITFIRPHIEERQANNIYIESFIKLQKENPSLNVSFRHLTTSNIGKEQNPEHRIGDLSVLSLSGMGKTLAARVLALGILR